MGLRIEDYALIGDGETAALVGRDGSMDWLCLPRFDSAACFAALLGGPEHGRWKIAPVAEILRVTRRYRPGTMVLETEFETAEGIVVADRLHAAAQRRGRCAAAGRGPARPGRHGDGSRHPLRLRRPDPLGAPRAMTAPCWRSAARTSSPSAPSCRSAGRIAAPSPISPSAPAIASPSTWSGRPRTSIPARPVDAAAMVASDGAPLAGLARLLPDRRGQPASGDGAALPADAEGADLCADGRHRRRAHHLPAGDPGRQPQLGLPLLLAARRGADPACAGRRRPPDRGRGLAPLAAARRRRQPLPDAAALWPGRRAPDAGADPALAAGLRGLRAGADRQCRRRPAPARRLRRGDGRLLRRPPGRPAADARGLGDDQGHARPPGTGLARARRGDLGGARPPPPLRAVQGHGLGRLRPGAALGRGIRPGRPAGALARCCATR